jgi:hypothetical protein
MLFRERLPVIANINDMHGLEEVSTI